MIREIHHRYTHQRGSVGAQHAEIPRCMTNAIRRGDVLPHVAPGFSLAAFLRNPDCETLLRDCGRRTLPRFRINKTCRSEERRYIEQAGRCRSEGRRYIKQAGRCCSEERRYTKQVGRCFHGGVQLVFAADFNRLAPNSVNDPE